MIFIAIGFAGALGALARYGVSVAALRWLGDDFPYGTLCVNLVGCFLLGIIAELTMEDAGLAPQTRAILGTGFLGAFTTFSTFGVDTYRAMQAGAWGVAASNVAVNVVGGLVLVAAGVALAAAMRS
jgi:fluoride exporter